MRLSFDISDDTHRVLCLIPHGLRKMVYRKLIESFADHLRDKPAETLHSAITGMLHFKGVEISDELGIPEEPVSGVSQSPSTGTES